MKKYDKSNEENAFLVKLSIYTPLPPLHNVFVNFKNEKKNDKRIKIIILIIIIIKHLKQKSLKKKRNRKGMCIKRKHLKQKVNKFIEFFELNKIVAFLFYF